MCKDIAFFNKLVYFGTFFYSFVRCEAAFAVAGGCFSAYGTIDNIVVNLIVIVDYSGLAFFVGGYVEDGPRVDGIAIGSVGNNIVMDAEMAGSVIALDAVVVACSDVVVDNIVAHCNAVVLGVDVNGSAVHERAF